MFRCFNFSDNTLHTVRWQLSDRNKLGLFSRAFPYFGCFLDNKYLLLYAYDPENLQK